MRKLKNFFFIDIFQKSKYKIKKRFLYMFTLEYKKKLKMRKMSIQI